MLTLLVSSLISISIVLVVRFINKPHVPPLFGIYQQKNKYYWFKFVILLVILYVRKWLWLLKRSYAVETGKSGDGTITVHKQDAALEQNYDLGTHPKAVDSVFFSGISEDGNAVAFMLARRPNNVCDAYVCIKLNGEEYLSPKLPDTHLHQDENDHGEFKVQGIQIENFIPMRTWKLSYNGEMKSKENSDKVVKVLAEFTWSALFAPFNHKYQMSPWSDVARQMAKEPWSTDYFRVIDKLNITYYEQMGSLKGKVNVGGIEHDLKMLAYRDRVFGKLDWRNIHRYVFHSFCLDNGDCVGLSTISEPLVMSHVTTGHVCRKLEPTALAVQSSDFMLFQHGENGTPPKNYGFSFFAGGKRYTVQVNVDSENIIYVGEHREAKLYDRWLTVVVNGVRGKGMSQWHYNNTS